MNPDDITLEKPSKSFEYEKISRDIEKINDIEDRKEYGTLLGQTLLKATRNNGKTLIFIHTFGRFVRKAIRTIKEPAHRP